MSVQTKIGTIVNEDPFGYGVSLQRLPGLLVASPTADNAAYANYESYSVFGGRVNGFGFSIPTGATITGVVLSGYVNSDLLTGASYMSAELFLGATQKTEYAPFLQWSGVNFGTIGGSGFQIVTCGYDDNTWSYPGGLTPEIVNSSDFSVGLSTTQDSFLESGIFYVAKLELSIYYTGGSVQASPLTSKLSTKITAKQGAYRYV